MKKILLWVSALLLLTVSCTEKNIINPQKCTLEDIAGTWIWILEDGESVPNSKIEIGTIKADGTEEYWSIVDDKWTKVVNPVSITNDGILHLSDVGDCYIVNFDKLTLTIETKKDRVRYSANRVMNTVNEQAVGTWVCDEYKISESLTCKNYTLIINEDGSYLMSYDGAAAPVSGQYGFCNDFFIYQSNHAGSILFVFGMDEKGPFCRHMTLAEDGTKIQNIMLRKPQKEYSINDLVGTWIWTMNADEPNNSSQITVVEYKTDGTETRWYIKDNKWVAEEGTFDVKDGNFINATKDARRIIHLDYSTFVLENPENHKRSSAEKVKATENPLLYGTWRCEPYNDGEKSMAFTQRTFREDGTYTVLGPDGSREGQYKLLNNFLFRQGASSSECVYLTFGKDQNGLTINQRTIAADGKMYENLFRRQAMQ